MEPPKSGAGRWNHQNQAPRDGTTEIRRLEMEPLKSRAKAHRAGTAKNQGIKSGNRQKSRHPETEPPKSGTQIRFRNPQNQAPGSGPAKIRHPSGTAKIRHPDQELPTPSTRLRNRQNQAPGSGTAKIRHPDQKPPTPSTRLRKRQNQAPGSGTAKIRHLDLERNNLAGTARRGHAPQHF